MASETALLGGGDRVGPGPVRAGVAERVAKDDRIVVAGEAATDPRWASLVARTPTTVFHSPAWIRVLTSTYGFPIRARMILDDRGVATAGLAYAEVDDILASRMRSLPFSDFCDPVAATGDEWRTLIEPLLTLGQCVDLRLMRNNLWSDDERFQCVHQVHWHGVDLSRSETAMWDDLHPSARRSIRKAQAAGVSVRVAADEDDLRAFFDLHVHVRKHKYGLLAQPYDFFRSIWQQFIEPGSGMLLLATYDGRIIAGVVLLRWQDVWYYKFNASNPDHLAVRPNDLLLWHGLLHGRKQGLRLLDFGISEPDQEGLVRYKEKYATEHGTVSFARYIPPGIPTAREREGRELFGEVTRLLVAPGVPDEVSERAGGLLYRYFT